jgi:hypothetical protein
MQVALRLDELVPVQLVAVLMLKAVAFRLTLWPRPSENDQERTLPVVPLRLVLPVTPNVGVRTTAAEAGTASAQVASEAIAKDKKRMFNPVIYSYPKQPPGIARLSYPPGLDRRFPAIKGFAEDCFNCPEMAQFLTKR